MNGIPRQGLAIAAATASLGLALVPASAPARLPGLPPIPGLPAIPALPATLPTDPAALAATLAALGIDTPEELAAVIVAADPAQLSALIQGLPPAQLQAALAQLTPEQLAAVTATVVALAAQAGAPPEVVALAQMLTGAVTGGGSDGTGGGGGTTTGGGTTAGGGGSTTGGGTTTGDGTSAGGDGSKPAVNRAIRAEITKVKLARNRRSVVVTLRCPTAAPACGVGLVGTSRGKRVTKAKLVTIAKGKSLTATLKLKRKAAKRLRSKGGKLLVAAGTVGSSLPPATRTVKAKKPNH